MTFLKGLGVAALVVVAVVLQTAVLSQVSIDGVVPDLALVVVVAAALVRGQDFGTVTGFAAGLAIDLAPPADHVAGRWALSLAVVGFLVGHAVDRLDLVVETSVHAAAVVGSCTLVASTLFAFTGVLVHDRSLGFVPTLEVIGISVAVDIVVAPLLLPLLVAAFRRLRSPHMAL